MLTISCYEPKKKKEKDRKSILEHKEVSQSLEGEDGNLN
jgi:hypothetical protein